MLQRYKTGKGSRTIPPTGECMYTSFLVIFLLAFPFFLLSFSLSLFRTRLNVSRSSVLFVRNRGNDLLSPNDSYLRLDPHDLGRTPGGSGRRRSHFYVTDAIRVFPPNDFHRDERTVKGKTRASWVNRDDTPRLSLASSPPFAFVTT